MVYGVWCMVYGQSDAYKAFQWVHSVKCVWCMVYGVWCMVSPTPALELRKLFVLNDVHTFSLSSKMMFYGDPLVIDSVILHVLAVVSAHLL